MIEADDLEKLFMRTFDAKPCLYADELTFTHGQTQYRLDYQLTFQRGIGSFVKSCILNEIAEGPGRVGGRTVVGVKRFASQDFSFVDQPSEVTKWVAKMLLHADTEYSISC